MQIGQQRGHLLLCKPAGKARHLALAHQNQPAYLSICSGCAAGQFRLAHRSMNIRRRRFQSEIVVFMTMRAANGVEMLPLRLLWREFLPAMTAYEDKSQCWWQHCHQHCSAPSSSSLLLRQIGYAFFMSANLLLTASQFTAEKKAFT